MGDFKVRMTDETHQELKRVAADYGVPMGPAIEILIQHGALFADVTRILTGDDWEGTVEAGKIVTAYDELLGRARRLIEKRRKARGLKGQN
ncbi:MAG: hypothetical protein KAY32_10550 [Candidatus Eisenbacteria sp.]|nr:hypothetical protein [Candidatus Eisenbacteria bacterium]